MEQSRCSCALLFDARITGFVLARVNIVHKMLMLISVQDELVQQHLEGAARTTDDKWYRRVYSFHKIPWELSGHSRTS